MSVNPLFGNKKRNSSIFYSVDQAKITASSSSFQGAINQSNIGNHGNSFPPNKRYKSLVPIEQKEMDDPFGDNDDFTADDLEEIDIIASQAFTQNFSLPTNAVTSELNARLPSPLNNTSKPSTHMKQSNVALTTDRKVHFAGSSTEETSTKDRFRLETLQAQYEETKRKLQGMQDEILIKNGEIRILRDSMQQMESTLEEQRKSHMLLEEEKEQHLREKEKELSKKLQSLQSELQFRDAEMNELRMKLLNCERIKSVIPSTSFTSPKKSPSSIVKIEGCSQNEKKSYPTKESFRCELSPKASCSKTLVFAQPLGLNEDSKKPSPDNKLVKQEMSYICSQRQGSILITALMRHPIVEGSSLGLCNLLSSHVEAQPVPVLQSSSSSTGCTGVFSNRNICSEEQEEQEEASLKLAQNLAVTGLNLIAMDDGSLDESSEENKRRIAHLKCYKIPGAVHLLPLLEHHIGAYCQALQLMMMVGGTSSGNRSASSSISSSTRSSVDDFQSNLEEFSLTSLGILYYLVFYSWDVVCTLLSGNMKPDRALGGTEVVEKDKTVACSKQCRGSLQEPNPQLDAANDDSPQHPLFKSLLHLLTLCTSAVGCQRHCILNQCLRVLLKLAEKSTVDLLMSFSPLLNSQVPLLLRCMSSEAPISAVHFTVRLLTLLAEHQELAACLCTASENCLLLALYMYITSRPDKSTSEMLWLQLEQETVHFLTKCMQCCSISLVGRECQCNPEVSSMCAASEPPPKHIETFVFMDLEATGLPPSQPKIAEMCVFAVNRHAFENLQYSNSSVRPVPLFPRLVDKLCICIDPDKPFTSGATSVTGLNNEVFAENKKQSFNVHIVDMITAFFNRQYPPVCLVAHSGCAYDFPLLKAELSALGVSALDEIYCADTIQAMKALDKENNQLSQFIYQPSPFGNKKNYKLNDLYFKFYKVYPLNSHSAEGDVITLIRVFQQRARDLMHWMDSNARQFSTIRAMYKGNERSASVSKAPWSLQHPSFLQVGPPRQRLATAYSSPVSDDKVSLRQNISHQGHNQCRPLNNTDIPDEIKNMLLFLLGLAILTWIVLRNPV